MQVSEEHAFRDCQYMHMRARARAHTHTHNHHGHMRDKLGKASLHKFLGVLWKLAVPKQCFFHDSLNVADRYHLAVAGVNGGGVFGLGIRASVYNAGAKSSMPLHTCLCMFCFEERPL
jgi:hypothetical protein